MNVHNHPTIPSLDGLRAVSIGIVFCAHAGLSPLLPGGFGVTVFFFLSGFLITTLFFNEAARTGSVNLRAFYIRRLLRLSPPLLVTLLFTYTMVSMGVFVGVIDPLAIASQALYLSNYYKIYVPGAVEGALGLNPLWSLAVEEHFYLIYPWLFLAFLNQRLNLAHVALLLLGFLLWRLLRAVVFGAPEYTIYASTDTRFDSILYGAFLAMLNARGLSDRIFPKTGPGRLALLAGAAGLLMLTFLWRDSLFRDTLRYSLQGIALMPVFHYAVTRPDLWYFRPLNWTPVRWIGIYSYTIYLIHAVILANMEVSDMRPDNQFAYALVAFALSVGFAALVYHLIEQPLKVWRQQRLPAPG